MAIGVEIHSLIEQNASVPFPTLTEPGGEHNVRSFRIVTNDQGETFIQCFKCETISYHPEDVSKLYCGNCREFHVKP